jgi:hypothetical protein
VDKAVPSVAAGAVLLVLALPDVGRFTNDTALELVVTTSAPNTAKG